ncbi:hypothetical protein CABS01_06779 [Colletotrichum abscissum]|uniref:Uncharacterized protein n=1 Tax=Colletotrichum abscissum TaxID=1671311 RepID=A0A9Q0AZ86_9PEZI|nr:uncharacterized protein CABS01_06779 [Colletotrichum abscissum]KAI3540891.1 hypothetical protein CABS02_10916 [Colletotrichum abscissum]KAK1514800.1 hypothetical protein CABS01_06779 [Colletotrichum abscissum]
MGSNHHNPPATCRSWQDVNEQMRQWYDSAYELTLCFPDIANELIAAGMLKQPDCTIAQLRLDHARDWETTEVLHIIPRDLLRSIIKGTVAMDFGPNRPHDYDEDSNEAGIYVIAVSVDSRDGKFLN